MGAVILPTDLLRMVLKGRTDAGGPGNTADCLSLISATNVTRISLLVVLVTPPAPVPIDERDLPPWSPFAGVFPSKAMVEGVSVRGVVVGPSAEVTVVALLPPERAEPVVTNSCWRRASMKVMTRFLSTSCRT